MKKIKISDLKLVSGVKFGTSGVRGPVVDMTDEVCYAYCTAFLKIVSSGEKNVVLGHDLRPSSPRLSSACIAAIQDFGLNVVYCGALPTPALAFYAAKLGGPAVVVTGSHIPFDRNGIKFYRANGEITKVDELAIDNCSVELPDRIGINPLPQIEPTARELYLNRYVNFFGVDSLSALKLGVYEHSSVARDLLTDIIKKLGATVISLGRTNQFVPIDTEAVRSEDVVLARRWAEEYKFDAILSTDGDSDRPLIGDENGEWIKGDLVGILCARYLNAQTVVSPVSSNTIIEKVGWFNHVVRTRIGSPFVISAMKGGDGITVGFEANGGFILGNEIKIGDKVLEALCTRDALLPMLTLLTSIKEKSCKMSKLIGDLPRRYTASSRLESVSSCFSSGLISRCVHDFDYAVSILAPDLKCKMTLDTTDGFRAIFDNGDIVHLRPSGNAPELRCYTESDSSERAAELCVQCLQRINKIVINN